MKQLLSELLSFFVAIFPLTIWLGNERKFHYRWFCLFFWTKVFQWRMSSAAPISPWVHWNQADIFVVHAALMTSQCRHCARKISLDPHINPDRRTGQAAGTVFQVNGWSQLGAKPAYQFSVVQTKNQLPLHLKFFLALWCPLLRHCNAWQNFKCKGGCSLFVRKYTKVRILWCLHWLSSAIGREDMAGIVSKTINLGLHVKFCS